MSGSGGEVNVSVVGVVSFLALIVFFVVSAVIVWLSYALHRKYRDVDEFNVSSDSARSTSVDGSAQKDINRPHLIHNFPRSTRKAIDIVRNSSTHRRAAITKYRYQRRDYIMTPRERDFYVRLFRLIGREYLIFPQIHLSTLFKHTVHRQNFKAALSAIQRKSVDYVFCDTNFRIMAALELDDDTHRMPERIERDALVNSIFADAGLPLIRIPTHVSVSDDELKSKILYAIGPASSVTQHPARDQ